MKRSWRPTKKKVSIIDVESVTPNGRILYDIESILGSDKAQEHLKKLGITGLQRKYKKKPA